MSAFTNNLTGSNLPANNVPKMPTTKRSDSTGLLLNANNISQEPQLQYMHSQPTFNYLQNPYHGGGGTPKAKVGSNTS